MSFLGAHDVKLPSNQHKYHEKNRERRAYTRARI